MVSLLTPEELVESGRFLQRLQEADGSLPWSRGDQWDAWNHTEALMGLTISGVATRAANPDADHPSRSFLGSARRGLEHLRLTQRHDGSWPMLVRDGVVEHDAGDTNQCAYPAVGVWHYALATGDEEALQNYWPMVDRALEYVLRALRPDGSVAWAIDSQGRLGDHALLTGNASILQSLWAGHRIGQRLGHARPHWLAAGNRLAKVVAEQPELFADRSRHSMDWFYPVLGGALTGESARQHLEAQWQRFVWAGQGVRCVDDHPWVTGGEGAELVMALMCVVDVPPTPQGEDVERRARTIMREISRLRAPGGGYWTGFVVPDDTFWPQEQTGWTAGSILLAADALDSLTPASNFFHAMTWPQEIS